ncbi:hypothetical protein [Chryseobacterium sp. VD8]|uniref:hypothetical protein n=1 Tax=Chryseobacterium sp. VD8 TaxID=3081254 RepID=UPI00301948E6
MRYNFLFAFVLVCQLSFSQTYVDQKTFENLNDIKVLSTEIVESSNANQLTTLKFKFVDFSDKKIKFYEAELKKNEFVSIKSNRYFPSSLTAISVMTVPFKVRAKNRQGYVTAQADVKNIGLYFPVALWDRKRYWLDNSTSSHKFSIGFMVAPMAQELSDKNTNSFFQNTNTSYNAFMLSTSLAITYTYKNITIAIIPLGFDFGLDQAGSHWDNHRKYWAGIGIGIDTKLFGF